MKDYSGRTEMAGRAMVVRWVVPQDSLTPIQVQGFDCDNDVYFFPEAGFSTGIAYTYENEFDAVSAALEIAEREYAHAAARVTDLKRRSDALRLRSWGVSS